MMKSFFPCRIQDLIDTGILAKTFNDEMRSPGCDTTKAGGESKSVTLENLYVVLSGKYIIILE